MCVAQLDRALGYGPRCREFESSHARFINEKDRIYILSFFVNKVSRKAQTGSSISALLRSAETKVHWTLSAFSRTLGNYHERQELGFKRRFSSERLKIYVLYDNIHSTIVKISGKQIVRGKSTI